MKLFTSKYRTGLVLSGGAARGIAHLGVLEALMEKNIKIDIISGVSAGSIAGALFLDGHHPREILEIFANQRIYKLIRISVPRSGFFKIDGLKKILKTNLKAKNIEDLERPLFIAVTNYQKARVEYFNEGPLVDLVLASSSIPVLFETKYINKIPYIDGGIMDNLPVDPILDHCKKIIGVHVNPIGEINASSSPWQVAERSFHMAVASEIRRKQELLDLFIEPNELTKFGLLELRRAEKIYKIGYDAGITAINNL
jgi:NTE family protein